MLCSRLYPFLVIFFSLFLFSLLEASVKSNTVLDSVNSTSSGLFYTRLAYLQNIYINSLLLNIDYNNKDLLSNKKRPHMTIVLNQ